MSIVFDRPVRDVSARFGTQTGCGCFAKILADFEPADRFAFVDAHDGSPASALREECVAAVCRGVIEELTRAGDGRLPAMRVVLRRILVHEVDSSASGNETAGRQAAAEALRRLGETR